ncbi:MAG: hypothetical protein JW834_04130 [Candidatus Diapherotrites archaeon]|nr:hypothetical protein [Candidatus Diapherotrites archaeon]
MLRSLFALWRCRRGDMNWTPIYLLILAAIAIILLVSVIKPMFQAAVETAVSAAPE